MAFSSDYWTSFDRREKDEENSLEIKPGDLGLAYGIGDPLQNLQAGIKTGAGRIELGFFGQGKSMADKPSPEMQGKDKREAMKQLAELNEVKITTHATVGVTGLTGMDERRFSDSKAENSMNEVRRAVDFAADVAQGGPVVVHSGDFPRDINDYYDKEFQSYDKEYPSDNGERRPVEEAAYLVNSETGEIQPISKGQVLHVPEYKRDSDGDFIDIEGNKISPGDVIERGVPVLERTAGGLLKTKMNTKTWKDFEREALSKYSNPVEARKQATKNFYISNKLEEVERGSVYEKDYALNYQETQKMLEARPKLEQRQQKITNFFTLEDYRLKKKEFNKLVSENIISPLEARQINQTLNMAERQNQDPGAILDRAIYEKFQEISDQLQRIPDRDQLLARANYYKDAFVGYSKQRKEIERQKKTVVPIEDFAMKRAAYNYARAADYAFDKEKAMGLKEPLFIAPENMMPEYGYGSHPQELKKLILKSREEFSKRLVAKDYSKQEADKIAREHIKATFDIGHAYTWKKYWKGKGNFDDWLLKQIDDLNKEDIIGHMHLSDNFGYDDEHLTVGEGAAPIKEFVEKMKKIGYKGAMITEGGAQGEGKFHETLTGAWSHLSTSPVFRSMTWTDVESTQGGGQAGYTGTPGYLVGKAARNISEDYIGFEKGKPFFSGLGLE